MKQRGMIGLVRVMTLISIIVIGIGAAPTLLLGPLIETQAKVAMQEYPLFRTKSFNGSKCKQHLPYMVG